MLTRFRRSLRKLGSRALRQNRLVYRAWKCFRKPDYPHCPVRQITRGPTHHWFGYYDKFETDPSDRFVLGMQVGFEHSKPRPDDAVRIGMIDIEDGDRWVEVGTSTAWCWQQGCMLQWRPGSSDEVLWNDRLDNHFICRIMNVSTRKEKIIPWPIYAVSPDGKWAVSTDFSRLNDVRPGYGYAGTDDHNCQINAPSDSGVFRIDLDTGERQLIISLAEIADIPWSNGDFSKAKHWFNHLLINPAGTRFVFLHRWKSPGAPWHLTRMLSASPEGKDLRMVNDSGWISHFNWADSNTILAYSRMKPGESTGLFLFPDKDSAPGENIGKGIVKSDCHCSLSPDRKWILYDSYPDRNMFQHLHLLDPITRKKYDIGMFETPRPYWGTPPQNEWRCDLHPRFSRNGEAVLIDSPHSWQGRQIHLVDVRPILQLREGD